MNVIGIIVQLILGLVLVRLFLFISTFIMKRENVVQDYTGRIRSPIFNGWVTTSLFVGRVYNTFNEHLTYYRDLPRSVNKDGGAQFSFTLWVKFDDTSDDNLKNKVIFSYGDPNQYLISRTIDDKKVETMYDYIIKCPLVKFSNNAKNIIIEYNTNENISNSAMIERVSSLDETKRHNIMSVMPGKWMMWTIVFSDNTKKESLQKGVEVRMYVNEFLHYSSYFEGSLRLNKGYLYILPEPIKAGFMQDLTYYNYALDPFEVMAIYNRGPTNKPYTDLENDPSFNRPPYITEYNKLEIHNL